MTARLIDGKAVAEQVEFEVREALAALEARGIRPGLVAVRVGNDPASEIYVRNKAKKAVELGLRADQLHFPSELSEDELLARIERLNGDDEVDGILIQLPLPRHIDPRVVLEHIDPAKDVDGFHPINVARLHLGKPSLVPCTPAGVIRLIDSTGVPVAGRHAVVVGRSDIVGKPLAALLLSRDATVTVCHSKSADLASETVRADILIAAVGRPHLIRGDMIKPGAVVIDVGMNRLELAGAATLREGSKKLETLRAKGSVLVGDVDFESAQERAGWITPVPGGVGPMTIAMLMRNTVEAARERRR